MAISTTGATATTARARAMVKTTKRATFVTRSARVVTRANDGMTTTTTTTTTTRTTTAADARASEGRMERAMACALALATMETCAPMSAHAANGEFGLFEGRTVALLHPAGMGALYAITLYAGYLGLQWRRVRTIGDEIAELKATMPKEDAAAAMSEAGKKVAELTSTRKELVAGKFKDKHASAGALLLAMGVALSVEGGMNTYLRTGKLFPGPHLYAGLTITVLWAMAAALIPAMEKGNDKARSVHIALNCLNLALFTWQIPTGLEIVGKVFQFTSWP